MKKTKAIQFLGASLLWLAGVGLAAAQAMNSIEAFDVTQEGGKVVIFLAMGLEAAKGLALGFLRRLRDLAWAAAGFVVLAAYQRR